MPAWQEGGPAPVALPRGILGRQFRGLLLQSLDAHASRDLFIRIGALIVEPVLAAKQRCGVFKFFGPALLIGVAIGCGRGRACWCRGGRIARGRLRFHRLLRIFLLMAERELRRCQQQRGAKRQRCGKIPARAGNTIDLLQDFAWLGHSNFPQIYCTDAVSTEEPGR